MLIFKYYIINNSVKTNLNNIYKHCKNAVFKFIKVLTFLIKILISVPLQNASLSPTIKQRKGKNDQS